jgi:lysophospholipase L1-like esterase
MKENKAIDTIRIFLAGDSTVASYPENEAPMAGWGQVIKEFFTDEIEVQNHAKCGASSNNFIDEGRLETIVENIRSNDYLFIQFCHNDQKEFGTKPYTTYPYYLTQYITGARKKGAIPVLVTAVHRRNFDDNGKVVNTHGEYPNSVIQLAEKLEVPLINLLEKTGKLYESFGREDSKRLFVCFKPNENENYPDGIQDNTHFCQYGAEKVAELVIEGLKELKLPITQFIKIN